MIEPGFDYRTLQGRIDLEGDSPAVRDYKAAIGAQSYALKQAGWSDEQIDNGLRTLFESTSAVLVEYLGDRIDEAKYTDAFEAVARSLVDKIDPRRTSAPSDRG